MYRFALRPRWLAAHVAFAALVVGCVLLGLWQLRRLDERKAMNALVRRHLAAEPVRFERAVRPGAAGATEYQRVRAVGTYDPGREVMVRSRHHQGRPGEHVLTPLVLADGRGVVVNRGWVPTDPAGGPDLAGTAPPRGRVEVVGLVRATEERKGFGPRDPAGGRLREVARVDLDRLQAQSARPLAPVWVQLLAQSPAQLHQRPVPVPPPDLGDGSHLSYALQWFSFATMGAVGWVLALRQGARRHAAAAPAGAKRA